MKTNFRFARSASLFRIVLAIGGIAFVVSELVASTLVVPPDRANQSGNGEWFGGFTVPTTEGQTVYGAKNFSTPIIITGIAFRADENHDQFTPSFDVTIPRFAIRLTTWSGSLNSFSGFYSFNKGADDTQVFDGSVHWSGLNASGNTPNPFDMQITFTSPFAYDPSRGSLLMEFDSSGPTTTSLTIGVDYDRHVDPAIGFTYTGGGEELGSLVTQFTFISIPEPSTVAILTVFGLIVGITFRKTK